MKKLIAAVLLVLVLCAPSFAQTKVDEQFYKKNIAPAVQKCGKAFKSEDYVVSEIYCKRAAMLVTKLSVSEKGVELMLNLIETVLVSQYMILKYHEKEGNVDEYTIYQEKVNETVALHKLFTQKKNETFGKKEEM